MIPEDHALIESQWIRTLTSYPPQIAFESIADAITQYRLLQNSHAQSVLIILPRAFLKASAIKNFTDRLRLIYACDIPDTSLASIVRASLSLFGATRRGLPQADAQNAQTLISQPLGVQKMHARATLRATQEALLFTPWPDVVDILCQNPTIQERDIVFMAARRPTQNALIEPILKSRWIARPAIRLALCANPYFNAGHAIRCALSLPRPQLATLCNAPDIHPVIQNTAIALLNLAPA